MYRNETEITNGSTQSLTAGTYNFTVLRDDNFNYSNIADNKTFVIDKNSSYVLGITGTSPIIYGTITDVAGSGCPSELTCALDKSNAAYGVDISPVAFNYSTAGNANYTSKSANLTITINKNSTLVLTQTYTSPIIYGTATDFTGVGCPSQLTCSLNLTNGIFGVGTINSNYSTNGNANYSASSNISSILINKASLTGNLINNTAITLEYPNPFNFSFSETNTGDADINYKVFRNNIDASNENNSNIILGVGTYDYVLNSTGGANYSANTSIEEFTVTITQNSSYVLALAIAPSATEVYPTQTTATGSGCPSEIICNLTLNFSGMVNNPHIITLGAGNYNYTYNTSGNANYSAKEFSDILVISQNTSAVIYTYLNNSRANITIYNNTAIWINATLFNVSGIIKLYKNNTLINSGTSPVYNLTAFNNTGMFNITAIYEENINYSGSFETWWVNVTASIEDTAKPNITINTPANSTYNTNSITFNVTAIDNAAISDCFYSLDSGITNNSLIASGSSYSAINSSMLQGSFKVNFYCNDSSNNLNDSEYEEFFIDSIKPLISITNPTANNSNFSYNTLDINFTYSDTNTKDCWYSNDTYSVNTTLASCANFTSIIWSEGLHNITIWVNDSANNVNKSSITFSIDQTVPLFTNLRNFTHTVNTSFSQSIIATDVSGISYYSLNDTAYFNINSAGLITNATNLSRIEIYYLNISVNDTLNNIKTGVFYINITSEISDTINPLISIISPLEGYDIPNYVSGGLIIDINASVNDTNLDSCWYNVSGSQIISDTTFSCLNGYNAFSFILSTSGSFLVYLYTNDSANNLNYSSFNMTITLHPEIGGGGGGSGTTPTYATLMNKSEACKTVYYFIISHLTNNQLEYTKDELLNLTKKISIDVNPVTIANIESYISNYNILCLNLTNLTLPKEINKILVSFSNESIEEAKIFSCSPLINISFFDWSLSCKKQGCGINIGDMPCNQLDIYKWLFKYENSENGYLLKGVKIYILIFLLIIMVISSYFLLKKFKKQEKNHD
jgi:hypothetical protein